jgi:hypothetical protein
MILFETTIRLRLMQGRAYPRFLSGDFVKIPIRHEIRPDLVIPVQQGDAARLRGAEGQSRLARRPESGS